MSAQNELQDLLTKLCQGRPPLQVALMVAEAYREVYGGEWRIKTKDSTFIIEQISEKA